MMRCTLIFASTRITLDRVIVSASGSLENLYCLRDILAVKPAISTQADSKTRSDMMLRLVYERITSLPPIE